MVLPMNDRNRIDQVIQNLTKNLKEFSEIILKAAESSATEKAAAVAAAAAAVRGGAGAAAGNGSASTAAADKPKKKKAEKDPNAPKRNLSSYMLYSQSVRPGVVKQFPTVRPVDIAKLIGEKWNALTDKEKQPFVKAAEIEKARYDKETKIYKDSLGEPAEFVPVKRKSEQQQPAAAVAAAAAEPVSEKKEKKKSKKSSSHESSDGKKRSHKKK